MLKEIFLTPEVFLESNMSVSNFYNLKSLLENISRSGFVLSLENRDWVRCVLSNISSCARHKDQLLKLIECLKDRERIEFQPKSGAEPQTEDDWLKIADSINSIRSISSIFSYKKTDRTFALEDLENMDIGDKYGYGGSVTKLKSEKELEKIFSTVVSYAKKLTIIDPYFYPDVYRYKRTLEIIAKNFGERRNNKTKGSIIIHCKFQIDNYNPWKKRLDKWRSICRHIHSNYGHTLTICAWKEKQGGIKMHERYLVTNQIGLVVGAGLDVNDRSTSEFGLKQYNELNDITSPFDKNNPSFDLIYETTMQNTK